MQSSNKSSPLNTGGRQFFQNWMSPVIRWSAQPVFREPELAIESQGQKVRQLGDLSRRALNVVVAGTSLLLASPVFLIIAVAVKLSSPGPVFFSQERVGLDKRRRATDRRAKSRGALDRRKSDTGGRVFRMYIPAGLSFFGPALTFFGLISRQ